jgi:hypothetical protein
MNVYVEMIITDQSYCYNLAQQDTNHCRLTSMDLENSIVVSGKHAFMVSNMVWQNLCI